jgi:hypothetical protein
MVLVSEKKRIPRASSQRNTCGWRAGVLSSCCLLKGKMARQEPKGKPNRWGERSSAVGCGL